MKFFQAHYFRSTCTFLFGEFKMTHQATINGFSLFSRMASVGLFTVLLTIAFVYFCDGRTPCVKIMTTYSALAWWVNFVLRTAKNAPALQAIPAGIRSKKKLFMSERTRLH